MDLTSKKEPKDINWQKNIALFMTGQGISLFGSMLVHYAVMWHITLKTQSGLMLTLTTIAGALPMFFISPFGGVWADRYNKKHIINIADASIAIATLIMAIIFSLGFDYTGLLLICLVTRALGQGVQTPAVNALIPEIVPQEHLTRINGISGSIQSAVMFASPMAGGALLAIAPIQALLFLDVITAAIGISILLFFVKTPAHTKVNDAKPEAKLYFYEIAQGMKYINSRTFIKKFILLCAICNFMIAPAAVLTPLQVARHWGDSVWNLAIGLSFGPEQRLAAIEVAFFAGMILGGIIIGVWGGFKNRSYSMAASVSLFGLGAIGLGLLTDFWLYMLCMGMAGIFMNTLTPPMMATLQTNVDSEYMGRVFSVLMMTSSLMMPMGMILWGPLADVIEIGQILVGTGIFLFFLGFVFAFDKTLLKAGAPVY